MLSSFSVMGFLRMNWMCSHFVTMYEMISIFVVDLVMRMSKICVVMISELVLDRCMSLFIIDMVGIEGVYWHFMVIVLVLLVRSIELIT